MYCVCRITIPEIRTHPWYVKPLPPPYNVAMADLYNQQRKIDEQVNMHGYEPASCRAQMSCVRPSHTTLFTAIPVLQQQRLFKSISTTTGH